MSSARNQRRARLREILEKVDILIERRSKLADSFMANVQITEPMVRLLKGGLYADKEFQSKWNRFQKMTQEIDYLRETGAKMIDLREKNNVSGGSYIKGIRDEINRSANK